MNLSRIEQETILVFNEAESTATVQVYNAKLHRRLEQLELERPDDVKHDYNGDFIIPKSWIRINPGIILSDEERAKKRENMKRIRQAQNLR